MINFQGAITPIYLINEDGEYKKYKNYTDAANDMGCYGRTISSCVNNPANSINGYYIVKAEDVEKRDRYGNLHLNEAKLMKKMHLSAQKRAVYAIDTNDNSYKRYKCPKQAAQELGIKYQHIITNLNGGSKMVDGHYIFARAYQVETIGDDGEVYVYQSDIDDIANLYTTKKICHKYYCST